MRPTLALLFLSLSAPAGAWAPEDVPTESGVPKEVSSRWNNSPGAEPG